MSLLNPKFFMSVQGLFFLVCVCVRSQYVVLCMYESEMCAEADKAINIMITAHDAMHRLKM